MLLIDLVRSELCLCLLRQVPQFHPQMAMMMDPYGMQKEKRSKKTKERKEAHCRTGNADLAACKADNQLNQIDFC